jgi:hypothetical protein
LVGAAVLPVPSMPSTRSPSSSAGRMQHVLHRLRVHACVRGVCVCVCVCVGERRVGVAPSAGCMQDVVDVGFACDCACVCVCECIIYTCIHP